MTARRTPIVQQAVASLLVAALGGYPVRALAQQGAPIGAPPQGAPVQSVPPPPSYAQPQTAPQGYAPQPVPAPAQQTYAPQPAPPQQTYAPQPQAAPQGYAPQAAPPQQTYPPQPQAAPQGYVQQPAPAQAPPAPAYAPPPPAYAPPAAAAGAPAAAPAPQSPGYAAPQGYAQQPAPAQAPPPPAYAPPPPAGQAPAAQGYAQQPVPAPPPPSSAAPAAAGAAAAGTAAAIGSQQGPVIQETPAPGPRLPPGAVPVPQSAAPAPAPARTGEAELGSAPPPPPPPGYAPAAPTSQRSTRVDDRLIRLEWRPSHVEGNRGWGPMVQVPVMGPEKRPLQGQSLYTALGRNDLAEEYERRAAAKRIMGVGSALLLISGVAVGISALTIHGCPPNGFSCMEDRDAQLRSRFYWSGGLVLGGAVLGIGSSAYSAHPVSRDELVSLIREHNEKVRGQPGIRIGAMAVPGGGALSLAGSF